MSKFLKLTSIIINKNYIHNINVAKNDKIVIKMMRNESDGFFLLGNGTMWSENTTINLCKIEHANDYKIVTDWIENDLF